jgi:hypothetical protein
MNKITLLGTMHKEIGKCNVDHLYNIIEDIDPNVIFEEQKISIEKMNLIMSFGNMDDMLQNESLERKTIRKYMQNHNIKVVPIDTLDIPQKFNEYHNILFRKIILGDVNYELWIDQCKYIENFISENGFEYINTNEFDNLIIKKLELQKNYIYNKHGNNLIEYYNECMNFMHEEREVEIINNIKKYFIETQNSINAVLLIGAEHRISLMKKLKKIKNIEFDFYYKSKSNF